MQNPKGHYRGTDTAKEKHLNAMKKYGGVEV
jgi:hypothetical protein